MTHYLARQPFPEEVLRYLILQRQGHLVEMVVQQYRLLGICQELLISERDMCSKLRAENEFLLSQLQEIEYE